MSPEYDQSYFSFFVNLIVFRWCQNGFLGYTFDAANSTVVTVAKILKQNGFANNKGKKSQRYFVYET